MSRAAAAVLAAALGVACSVVGSADAAADSADLAVAVAPLPARAGVGERVTFAVTAENRGPEPARGVVLGVSAGGRGTIVSAAAPGGRSCTIAATAKRVRCVLGSLDAGQAVRIELVVESESASVVPLAVTIGGKEPDPDTSNQTARAEVRFVEHDPPHDVRLLGRALRQPFQVGRSFAVAWTAADGDSGIAGFDVRVRSLGPGGARPAVVWQKGTLAHRAVFGGRPGWTYCFSARAADADGNASDWTAERCTSVAVPADAAGRQGRWRLGERYGAAPRTLTSRQQGATLVLRNVAARRLALAVSRCPGCGSARVLWNGRVVRTLRLGGRTYERVVLPVAEFAGLRTGTLGVEVVSDGAPVTVVAFGAARA